MDAKSGEFQKHREEKGGGQSRNLMEKYINSYMLLVMDAGQSK